ncbi:MAG: hypothetical protein VW989_08125 [Rhodobiaceae bacterium]|jgi:hypothetical protein
MSHFQTPDYIAAMTALLLADASDLPELTHYPTFKNTPQAAICNLCLIEQKQLTGQHDAISG